MQTSTLKETEEFFKSLTKKSEKPSDVETIYYVLAKTFGISKLQDYPIPYLLSLIKAHTYIKELETKEYKKSKSKK